MPLMTISKIIFTTIMIALHRRGVILLPTCGRWNLAVSATSTLTSTSSSSSSRRPVLVSAFTRSHRRLASSNVSGNQMAERCKIVRNSPSRLCLLRGPTAVRVVCDQRRFLNRFLFDPEEVMGGDNDEDEKGQIDRNGYFVVLPKDDYRTQHAAKVLNLHNGDTIRAGVVQNHYPNPWAETDAVNDVQLPSSPSPPSSSSTTRRISGHWTDQATIQWFPEGKVKKAEPLSNGDPPGSLRVQLCNLVPSSSSSSSASSSASSDHSDFDGNSVDAGTDRELNMPSTISSVSLLLALPRPLQLGRMLPMIAQMGVSNLIVVGSKKVPKDYFGSHLFRKPHQIKDKLIEGLCQAGDVHLPTVRIVRNLQHFCVDDLDELFPLNEYARVVTHPERRRRQELQQDGSIREAVVSKASRMRDVEFPSSQQHRQSRKILIAVGPEGGWEEPDELDMLIDQHGFQHVTMGARTLRSDCAVISLLALAHDAVDAVND